MIQRIQTLYFLFTAILCVVTSCLSLGRWVNEAGEVVGTMGTFSIVRGEVSSISPFGPLLVVVALVMVMAILIYHHRVYQSRLAIMCILLIVGWYVVYGSYAYFIAPASASFMPEWGAALPVVNVWLLWLGWRAVMKDEMLVRSLDRLR